jgi:hypothetical protein
MPLRDAFHGPQWDASLEEAQPLPIEYDLHTFPIPVLQFECDVCSVALVNVAISCSGSGHMRQM